MSNLQLPLKKQWFDLTKSGVKTEDYREITAYWLRRLFKHKDYAILDDGLIDEVIHELKTNKISFPELYDWAGWFPNEFDSNIMTLGYPKSTDSDRILKLEHKGIEIREGNPEWGAIPGRKYFVILHGSFLK